MLDMLDVRDPHDPHRTVNVHASVPETTMLTFAQFRSLAVSLCAVTLALIAAPAAHAQTYSNPTWIEIPDQGTATPYPSTISVTGGPTSLGYLSVTLNNFTHRWVADIKVMLVSPSGQNILLMANTNSNGDAVNATLTFIPDGTVMLPDYIADVESGVYACSVYFPPAAAPSPAPAGPYGTSLAPLIGTNANGVWSLYVWDDGSGDSGEFRGGWSITFNQPLITPTPTSFTYQGQLASGGSPVSGEADVRFTLCTSPTAQIGLAAIGPVITRNLTGISSGLINTPLDFGAAIDAPQALWLNIEVSSPPGSPFVTLAPRQAITPTPQARVAQIAVSALTALAATNATNATNAAVVPWSGITDVPANVSGAFSPWSSNGQGIGYTASGNVGIGTNAPAAKLDVTTGSISVNWQTVWKNNSVPNSRGGARLADNGFFEMTNNALPGTPNFARLNNAGTWSAVSDARLKTDITSAEGNLVAAMKLRPVNFRWKADGAEDFGLIAQEVRDVLPKLVTGDEAKDSLTLNYSQLSVVAIGAIQELKAQHDREINAMKVDAAKRDAENTDLKARLAAIEASLLTLNTDSATKGDQK